MGGGALHRLIGWWSIFSVELPISCLTRAASSSAMGCIVIDRWRETFTHPAGQEVREEDLSLKFRRRVRGIRSGMP